MTTPKPYSKQLQEWMTFWYEYTSENKDAKRHDDFKELQRIIHDMKREGL